MANLPETDNFDAGIYQLETTDPALGGANGVMNTPPKALTNRTRWLYNRVLALFGFNRGYAVATGTANAVAANYAPAVAALTDGAVFSFKAAAPNTGAATFTPCDGSVAGTAAITPLPVYGLDLRPLSGGELAGQCAVRYDAGLNGGTGAYALIENPGGIMRVLTAAANDSTSQVASTRFVHDQIQAQSSSYVVDTGVANAYAASLAPALTAYTDGLKVRTRISATNTGPSTLNAGAGAKAIVGGAHAALQGGELFAGGYAEFEYNSVLGAFVLLFCTGAAEQIAPATATQHALNMGQAFISMLLTSNTAITPSAHKTVVFPNSPEVAAVTINPGSVQGQEIVVYGFTTTSVVVASSASSGPPFFALADGSSVNSITLPASTRGGIVLTWDGSNWRGKTFGQEVVANATAFNQAAALNQMTSGANVYAVDSSGAANTVTLAFSPARNSRSAGAVINFQVANTNTGSVTINDGAAGAATLYYNGSVLAGGELVAGFDYAAICTSSTAYALTGRAAGRVSANPGTAAQHAVTLGQAIAVQRPAGAGTISVGFNIETVVFPAFAAAGTLTLSPGSVTGQKLVIYGAPAYQVTVASNASSGSPDFFFPDGSASYSYVLPASSLMGIVMTWDGGNWRCQTFGQEIVANATSGNQAVALGQFSTTVSGAAGTAGSYTITKWPDPTSPSGVRVRMTGVSQPFSAQGTQQIVFPLALNFVCPGSEHVTTVFSTYNVGDDLLMQVIGAATTTGMTIAADEWADGDTWPVHGNWSIEGG